MNRTNPLALLALAALCAAPAAALDFDSPAVAPAGLAELRLGFKTLGRRLAAEKDARPLEAVPGQAVDAFAAVPACAVVDAVNIRAYALDEAVGVLAPCLQALSKKYAVSLGAAAGVVASSQGRGEAMGIQLRIAGATFIGKHARMDLERGLALRHGSLLGFPAAVSAGVTAMGVAPRAFVPNWVEGASLTLEPRQTRLAGVEGGLRVVLFDGKDNQVEFEVPPAPHADAATVTFTMADDREMGPFPVAAVEAQKAGALSRLVDGVAIPDSLDARTRAAVAAFFASLR